MIFMERIDWDGGGDGPLFRRARMMVMDTKPVMGLLNLPQIMRFVVQGDGDGRGDGDGDGDGNGDINVMAFYCRVRMSASATKPVMNLPLNMRFVSKAWRW